MNIKYFLNEDVEASIKSLKIKNTASLEEETLTILNIDKIYCSNNATEISGETSNEIEGLSLKQSKNVKVVKKINENYNTILNSIKNQSDKIQFNLETILS